jgi:hypothetical protein
LTSTKLAQTEKLVKPELEFKNVDNELDLLKDTLEEYVSPINLGPVEVTDDLLTLFPLK